MAWRIAFFAFVTMVVGQWVLSLPTGWRYLWNIAEKIYLLASRSPDHLHLRLSKLLEQSVTGFRSSKWILTCGLLKVERSRTFSSVRKAVPRGRNKLLNNMWNDRMMSLVTLGHSTGRTYMDLNWSYTSGWAPGMLDEKATKRYTGCDRFWQRL